MIPSITQAAEDKLTSKNRQLESKERGRPNCPGFVCQALRSANRMQIEIQIRNLHCKTYHYTRWQGWWWVHVGTMPRLQAGQFKQVRASTIIIVQYSHLATVCNFFHKVRQSAMPREEVDVRWLTAMCISCFLFTLHSNNKVVNKNLYSHLRKA